MGLNNLILINKLSLSSFPQEDEEGKEEKDPFHALKDSVNSSTDIASWERIALHK